MIASRQVTKDTLYGACTLELELADLAATPLVQRLRHVRLSNIDSLDMPGIANLSRYEHVLGACHLAGEVAFLKPRSADDRIVLQASAMLHDCTITSFGHLVEEAFQYLGTSFHHEDRLREIVSGERPDEIGGVERQILVGRESGLRKWAQAVAESPTHAEHLISDISDHIRGNGRMGRVIAGGIDLDNIDNVFRMAFHMGLPVDRGAPVRLARSMVALDEQRGEPVFSSSAVDDIQLWRSTREAVYQHLMLAPRDFAGKLMMLYATIRAFQAEELATVDWSLTDDQLVARLCRSPSKDVADPVTRWMAGELWDLVPLTWMQGGRPDYPHFLSFSEAISEELGRKCFAYGIKDKRHRRLSVRFDKCEHLEFGRESHQWLLGIGSSTRRPFASNEKRVALQSAASYFGTDILGPADQSNRHVGEAQPCLF